MEVIFNAKTYDNYKVIEEPVKENAKHCIISIYNTVIGRLDLSLLNVIVIPENYEIELFELQKRHEQSEYLTKNEYGRGVAQVVSHKSGDLYDIIIDKSLILTLVPEDALGNMKDILGDQYEIFWYYRQQAIYTICHEFSHIHEYAINIDIEWINELKDKEDLRSQYLKLALQMWSEYFACRTASFTLVYKSEDWAEIIKTSTEAESMLQKKRSRYNRNLLSLEEFVKEFHNYTSFILKKIASVHGNLYSLNHEKEEMIQILSEGFKSSYVNAIWIELGDILNNIYDLHPQWTDHTVFEDLIIVIEKYYKQFEIFIREISEGVYYDIPVKL